MCLANCLKRVVRDRSALARSQRSRVRSAAQRLERQQSTWFSRSKQDVRQSLQRAPIVPGFAALLAIRDFQVKLPFGCEDSLACSPQYGAHLAGAF